MSFLSFSVKQCALIGESGIHHPTNAPHNTVKIPYAINKACQELIREVEGINEKQNANRPPNIWFNPFIMNLNKFISANVYPYLRASSK
jgi:hypothetical protein